MNLFVIFYRNLRLKNIRTLCFISVFVITLFMFLSVNNYIDLGFTKHSYSQHVRNGIVTSLSTLEQLIKTSNISEQEFESKRQEEKQNFKDIGTNQKGNDTSEENEGLVAEPSAKTAKSWPSRQAHRAKNKDVPRENTRTDLTLHRFGRVKNSSAASNALKSEIVADTRKFKESIEQVSKETWVNGKNTLSSMNSKHSKRTLQMNDSARISESRNLQTHKQSGEVLSTETMSRRKVTQNLAGLNVHLWFSLCAKSVSVLCNHPSFPLFPDLREHLRGKLDLERKEKDFAQRIFGFIFPPESGQYRFQISSDEMSQLWLSSDANWRNAQRLCNVHYSNKTESSSTAAFHISPEIRLTLGRRYYIEIVHAQTESESFLQVSWRRPGVSEFEIIGEEFTSLYNHENTTSGSDAQYIDSRRDSFNLVPVCKYRSHSPQTTYSKGETHQYISHFMVEEALPYCDYEPSYAKIRTYFLNRHSWKFLWKPVRRDTLVYPYKDYPEVKDGKSFPPTPLPREEAETIFASYLEKIQLKYPAKFKLLSLLNVERKLDEKKGRRYLVEAKMEVQGHKRPMILSEYIFNASSNGSLCYPSGLQWNRTANIGLVVTIRNQGKWMVHFLNNLEHIYLQTRDRFVTLVVFDYESTDIDINSTLKDRTLPPYKLIRRPGVYSRSKSFNAAVKLFEDPHTIIFALDLHLDLPVSLFEDIRKHCFPGITVYTPIILRLKCGESPANPRGRWESQGFGLIGIYKEDWDRLGGLDQEHFDKEWGGEDWDLMERIVASGMEYERLKNTKIFHYWHTRKGMWTGDPKIDKVPLDP